jgi:hypothetical protein
MPNEADTLDGIDPHRYVDEAGEEVAKQAALNKLVESLRRRRIFFYPACGFDWNPLQRFTHLCDDFVYCDYRMTADDFSNRKESIRNGVFTGVGLEVGDICNLHTEAVMDLATPDAEQADDFPNVGGAWGKIINLTRHIGNVQRKIRLLYFRAEGATLYRNLFNKRFIAPRMVCFKQCLDGFGGENWSTFLRWDGPLGRPVWDNRGRPQFVVSAYDPPHYDWPWSRVWQHHNWDSGYNITHLKSYVLLHELPASAGTPERCNGVIAHDVKTMHPIGERTIIRLKRPPHSAANLPDGARIVPLRREGRVQTLDTGLRELRETWVRDGTQDVHSIGCHFEDEAPTLYAWKWSGSQPKTLTIHCETEGDLACYGPAADEVLD